ncbi:unnamed protein product [Citrullus colocynthis]|uniref:Secreted protein n=1 Tax=Citrullus colocynthis TaxID=252529 RepID=A0ABP0YHE0_9ROSI
MRPAPKLLAGTIFFFFPISFGFWSLCFSPSNFPPLFHTHFSASHHLRSALTRKTFGFFFKFIRLLMLFLI